MSDIEEGGELSPEAKAFLTRHQATGEPSSEELARGLQRLSGAPPAPALEAKVLPLRRKRPFVPPEVLAAAAVVTLLLGAQAAYLVFRTPPEPATTKEVQVKPSGEQEVKAIAAAWTAGDIDQARRLASRECATDECRPLASELDKMLERSKHLDALTPEQRDELLQFDLKLSDGKGTALAGLLRAPPNPGAPSSAEQLALGERLFNEAKLERSAQNLEKAAELLEQCANAAPAHHPCLRLLGSTYASIAMRDQNPAAMEEARRVYALFLEVAPADDEYVPKVRAILDADRDEPAPRKVSVPASMSLLPGQLKALKIPGLSRIAIGDPAVADVKTLGNNELLITGASAGKTTMLVWTTDGTRHSTLIEVWGNRQSTLIELRGDRAATPARESEDLTAERDTVITIEAGGEGKVSFGQELTRVAVGDPEIADLEVVGSEIRLKGLRPGKTTVLGWLTGGERKSILVTVVASPAKARALLEAAHQARELYLRGYQLRDQSPEEARKLFSTVMTLTAPEDDLHQKAKLRLAELAP